MKKIVPLLFIFGFFLIPFTTQAQVGIGTSTPDSSSILELSSDSLGFLVPRMTLAQRNAISNPSKGLLIYQTNGNQAFYFYTGSSWDCLLPCSESSGTSPIEWDIGWTPGPDGDTMSTDTMMVATDDDNPLFFGAAGLLSGVIDPVMSNVTLGASTPGGVKQASAKYNVFIGDSAGTKNVRGSENLYLGERAGGRVKYGKQNICLGAESGVDMDSAINSVAIGYGATVNQHHSMRFGNSEMKRWSFGVEPNMTKALVVGNDNTNGNGAYLSIGGTWMNGSSKTYKHNITAVHAKDILKKVNQLPIYQWTYNGGNERHIGPLAEDFYQLFATGSDSLHISTIDPSGVALASVQALSQETENLKESVKLLALLLADQQAEIKKLKQELDASKLQNLAKSNK